MLVVDDEEPFLLSLVDALEPYANSFRVVTALDGALALEMVSRLEVDLVVTDLKMPGMDGFALLTGLRSDYPHIPTIVISAYNSPETEARLLPFAPRACLEKPVDLGELVGAVLCAVGGAESDTAELRTRYRSFLLIPLLLGLLAALVRPTGPAGQVPRVDGHSSPYAHSLCGRVWR